MTGDKPDAPGWRWPRRKACPSLGFLRLTKDKSQFFEALNKALETAEVDLIALAGFMRIIPTTSSSAGAAGSSTSIRRCCPNTKGLGTHEAVLDSGRRSTGATVHLVTDELDSGEILGQVEVAVLPATIRRRSPSAC